MPKSYWTTTATPIHTSRSEIASVLLNNKIYIIGGFENGHSTTTVEVYDPALDKRFTVATLYHSH